MLVKDYRNFLKNLGCVSIGKKLNKRLMFQKESRSTIEYVQKLLFKIFLISIVEVVTVMPRNEEVCIIVVSV